jgi:predicted MFS family arabinose efflux permease
VAHLTGIWKALGLRPADVPAFQAAMGLATIAGRLLGGALMDRVPAQFVGAGAALIGAAGIALLASGPGTAAATMVVAMAVGLCTGSESDVISFLSSRFFGLRHFARIYAVQGSFFMIGFSLGPIVAATGFDRIGVPGVLSACAGALVGSSLVLALLRGPTRAAR